MFDNRLQALARRFNEGGEGELEYLRAKIAAGLLEEDRLRIAAYCGNKSAQKLVQQAENTLTFLEPWVKRIPRYNEMPSLALRIGIIISLNAFPRLKQSDSMNLVRQGILCGVRCLLAPSEAVEAEAKKLSSQLIDVSINSWRSDRVSSVDLGSWASPLAIAVASDMVESAADIADGRSDLACSRIARAAEQARFATGIDGVVVIKQLISHSLIPWALGYKDPLLDLLAELEKGDAS